MAQETSGIVETYTSCYDWHIENAVEWKEAAKSSDFRLKSDKIKIENFPMKWRIELFSDGKIDTGLKFKIRLVQNKGSPPGSIDHAHYHLKVFIIRGSERINWLCYDNGRTLVKLLPDNTFEQYIGKLSNLKSFLNNGQSFDLQVNVKILQDTIEVKNVEQVDDMIYKVDTLNYFKNLLDAEGSSMATIHFGDNSYKVHKTLLSARSEVFADLFESTPDIKDYDIDGHLNKESVDAFIKFLYTGDCDLQTLDNAKNLVNLAHKFKVNDLKEIYENMLMTQITTFNAMELLQFAVKFDSVYGLKEAAFDALKKQYKTINIDIPDELMEAPSELINFAADAMAELVSKIQL